MAMCRISRSCPTGIVRGRWGRSGAVTLELALVAPVFFFIVFGIVEVGRGFMVIHLLTNATRDGCRHGIIEGTSTATIKTVVGNDLQNQGVNGATVTVA